MTGNEAVLNVVSELNDCGVPYMLVGSYSTLNAQVWLPTPEDVIVTKLQWALLANRTKDRDDARDVIAVQRDQIDWDYVHHWCEQHGTRSLLDEIRASIPMI
jgi:hypothetical protein